MHYLWYKAIALQEVHGRLQGDDQGGGERTEEHLRPAAHQRV